MKGFCLALLAGAVAVSSTNVALFGSVKGHAELPQKHPIIAEPICVRVPVVKQKTCYKEETERRPYKCSLMREVRSCRDVPVEVRSKCNGIVTRKEPYDCSSTSYKEECKSVPTPIEETCYEESIVQKQYDCKTTKMKRKCEDVAVKVPGKCKKKTVKEKTYACHKSQEVCEVVPKKVWSTCEKTVMKKVAYKCDQRTKAAKKCKKVKVEAPGICEKTVVKKKEYDCSITEYKVVCDDYSDGLVFGEKDAFEHRHHMQSKRSPIILDGTKTGNERKIQIEDHPSEQPGLFRGHPICLGSRCRRMLLERRESPVHLGHSQVFQGCHERSQIHDDSKSTMEKPKKIGRLRVALSHKGRQHEVSDSKLPLVVRTKKGYHQEEAGRSRIYHSKPEHGESHLSKKSKEPKKSNAPLKDRQKLGPPKMFGKKQDGTAKKKKGLSRPIEMKSSQPDCRKRQHSVQEHYKSLPPTVAMASHDDSTYNKKGRPVLGDHGKRKAVHVTTEHESNKGGGMSLIHRTKPVCLGCACKRVLHVPEQRVGFVEGKRKAVAFTAGLEDTGRCRKMPVTKKRVCQKEVLVNQGYKCNKSKWIKQCEDVNVPGRCYKEVPVRKKFRCEKVEHERVCKQETVKSTCYKSVPHTEHYDCDRTVVKQRCTREPVEMLSTCSRSVPVRKPYSCTRTEMKQKCSRIPNTVAKTCYKDVKRTGVYECHRKEVKQSCSVTKKLQPSTCFANATKVSAYPCGETTYVLKCNGNRRQSLRDHEPSELNLAQRYKHKDGHYYHAGREDGHHLPDLVRKIRAQQEATASV